MRKNLITALWMTIATTILLGIIYPLVVTGLAQVLFPEQANGELIRAHGKVVGSRLIAQAFTGREYFHPRPSAVSYDPTNSNGSQLGPTNQKLIDRVKGDVAALHAEHPGVPVPIDLVTASASGFDPDISPAAAEFQLARVAKERGATLEQLRALVAKYTDGRQFGIFGEPRVNVLELNLELDQRYPMKHQARAEPGVSGN
ncbi:MAG TPA: potassium-transporting ATPase subunit KdpC [Terriglobales bacterium]|nr:potassium-transporting ATPase subunit KdpC [Terriglobales bacterium]